MPPSPKPLRLLCDENVPIKLTQFLVGEGHEVSRAPRGSPDEAIAPLARAEDRIIVTFDKHFAQRWRFPPEQYSGIVFLKIRPPLLSTAKSAIAFLFSAVGSSQFRGRLFVVTPFGYRVYPKM